MCLCVYICICVYPCFCVVKEGNVLFNDALNTFYLRLYGIRHMVKDHLDSERGNLLPPHGLLFLLYAPSHRQDSTYHSLCYTSGGSLTGTTICVKSLCMFYFITFWMFGSYFFFFLLSNSDCPSPTVTASPLPSESVNAAPRKQNMQ